LPEHAIAGGWAGGMPEGKDVERFANRFQRAVMLGQASSRRLCSERGEILHYELQCENQTKYVTDQLFFHK